MVGKCGTHQAALSAKSGVIGPVAAAIAGEGQEFEGVTANAVRLFKYLVPQYYEEFKISVPKWVHDNAQPQAAGQPHAAHQPQAAGQPQATATG